MDDYFLKQISDGRELDVLLLSHNSHWQELKLLDSKFDNLSVHAYGESTNYLDFLEEKEPFTENADLILLYSLGFFSEYELGKLKEIMFDIAKKQDKRVNLGYSYMIPFKERTNKKIPFSVKVISCTKDSIIEEEMEGLEFFSALDLAGLSLSTGDILEKTKNNSNYLSQKLVKKLTNNEE